MALGKLPRFLELILASSLFLVFAPVTGIAENGNELQYADLGECQLESGASILDCRIGFRIFGKHAGEIAKIIVVPTWHTGTALDVYASDLIGPGKLYDTSRYRIIVINALGNGISSSPSNNTRQSGTAFPGFSIRDMVNAQHRLLTEHLLIDHVHTVSGLSMGGNQVFEWLMNYPGFADHFVSIEGTPWLSSYDKLLWQSLDQLLGLAEDDKEKASELSTLLPKMDALFSWTPAYVIDTFKASESDKAWQTFSIQKQQVAASMLDRRSQVRAVLDHDIRTPYGEKLQDRLDGLGPVSGLVIVFDTDMTLNPGPSLELAHDLNLESHVLPGRCGHYSTERQCELAELEKIVRDFMQSRE